MQSTAEIIAASGIGASEIAAIVGISPFATAWEVYARHRGLTAWGPPTDAMRCGLKFQKPIAELFSEDTGIPHEWWDKPYYHPERPWHRASVDAFIPSVARPEATLEVKAVGLAHAGDWDKTEGGMGEEDQLPEYVVAQAHYQLSAHNLGAGYVAACICGNELRYYRIERDPEIEEFLLDQAEAFWRRHILSGVEPPPGRSEEFRRYIKRRYPREKEPLRPATVEEIALLDEYADVRAALKPIEERKEELENDLRQAVKDAEGLEWARGKFTYRKANDKQRVAWEKLAKRQLEGYSEEEKKTFYAEFTETEPGSRRIYFKDLRREAA